MGTRDKRMILIFLIAFVCGRLSAAENVHKKVGLDDTETFPMGTELANNLHVDYINGKRKVRDAQAASGASVSPLTRPVEPRTSPASLARAVH